MADELRAFLATKPHRRAELRARLALEGDDDPSAPADPVADEAPPPPSLVTQGGRGQATGPGQPSVDDQLRQMAGRGCGAGDLAAAIKEDTR